MQVLEWAATYPEAVYAAAPIATAAHHSAQNIAFHEVGRAAIHSDPDWRGGRYWEAGIIPAKGLSVARMVAHITYLSEKALIQKVNESELFVKYHTGSYLHVVGLDAYQRVEGTPWHAAGITEYQEVNADFFGHTLEPILNDTRGRAILEGRPTGKNHFFDDFRREVAQPHLWASYTWKSADVLSAQQIEDAKRSLSDEDFRREYEADFESGGQRVYHAFGPWNLRAAKLESGPVIVACDFNAMEKPMSWNIGQEKADGMYWIKSLSYPYTNTETMCGVLDTYLKDTLGSIPPIRFYGDFAGKKNTSNSSIADWEIIRNAFPNSDIRIQPCLSVRNRVSSTNGMLKNAAGETRMYAHPNDCKALTDDWERVQWKANGVELEGEKDKRLTHSSDAVDYWSDYEHSIIPKARRVN
jgi:hypothetical protein